jgi:hypothetical protein
MNNSEIFIVDHISMPFYPEEKLDSAHDLSNFRGLARHESFSNRELET